MHPYAITGFESLFVNGGVVNVRDYSGDLGGVHVHVYVSGTGFPTFPIVTLLSLLRTFTVNNVQS